MQESTNHQKFQNSIDLFIHTTHLSFLMNQLIIHSFLFNFCYGLYDRCVKNVKNVKTYSKNLFSDNESAGMEKIQNMSIKMSVFEKLSIASDIKMQS